MGLVWIWIFKKNVFSLEQHITNLSEQKYTKDFLVESQIPLQNHFLTLPMQSYCSCNKFQILVWNQALQKEPTLIDVSWDLKYSDDGDLVFPLDEFQVCSIFNIFTHKKPSHGCMWPMKTQGLFLFSVNIWTIQLI